MDAIAEGKTWMWAPVGGEPQGVVLDAESESLHWYTGLGCTCGEDIKPIVQAVRDYLRRGAPGLVSEPPGDIAQEIYSMIENSITRG